MAAGGFSQPLTPGFCKWLVKVKDFPIVLAIVFTLVSPK